MNYFELFNIPLQLKVEKETLRQKYFDLSRQYHPGCMAYRRVAACTTGRRTTEPSFSNPAKRGGNHQVRVVTKRPALERITIPPRFLRQMQELQEEPERVPSLYAVVHSAVEHYQEGVATKRVLPLIRDYYFKKKYIHGLLQQMAQKS